MREPYNVLVLPYALAESEPMYCIFLREDMQIWQFVAGGGENRETPEEAARREAFEEANISPDSAYRQLTTMTFVPVYYFSPKSRAQWGKDRAVIPVHCFSVKVDADKIAISQEHTDYRWVSYRQAIDMLHFDVDRTSLWELHYTLGYIKDE